MLPASHCQLLSRALTASAVPHERSGSIKRRRSKFSEEQIVYAIRQAESGAPVGNLCRQLGASDAAFYAWKKKYAHLGVSELQRLRQVKEENSRLKGQCCEILNSDATRYDSSDLGKGRARWQRRSNPMDAPTRFP